MLTGIVFFGNGVTMVWARFYLVINAEYLSLQSNIPLFPYSLIPFSSGGALHTRIPYERRHSGVKREEGAALLLNHANIDKPLSY